MISRTQSIYSQKQDQKNILEELKDNAIKVAMKADPKFKASYKKFLKEQVELQQLSEDCEFVDSTLYRVGGEVKNALLVDQSTSSRARIKRATDHLCSEGSISKFTSGGAIYFTSCEVISIFTSREEM